MLDYGGLRMRTVPPSVASQPAPRRDRAYWTDIILGRTLPSIFFGLFLAYQLIVVYQAGQRLTQPAAGYDEWLQFLNRVERLAFIILLVVMYVVRIPARGGDRRPLVVVVSLTGTFAVVGSGFLPGTPHGSWTLPVADLLICFGLAWAVWGLAYLRRSFSILPEARRLVTGGPYALSRNPLYFGEGIASVGVILPFFGLWHALLLAIFISSQLLRIRWEQRVLEQAFGEEFRSYLRRVPVLVPFWPGRR